MTRNMPPNKRLMMPWCTHNNPYIKNPYPNPNPNRQESEMWVFLQLVVGWHWLPRSCSLHAKVAAQFKEKVSNEALLANTGHHAWCRTGFTNFLGLGTIFQNIQERRESSGSGGTDNQVEMRFDPMLSLTSKRASKRHRNSHKQNALAVRGV